MEALIPEIVRIPIDHGKSIIHAMLAGKAK
jgi:hypothetical protein